MKNRISKNSFKRNINIGTPEIKKIIKKYCLYVTKKEISECAKTIKGYFEETIILAE